MLDRVGPGDAGETKQAGGGRLTPSPGTSTPRGADQATQCDQRRRDDFHVYQQHSRHRLQPEMGAAETDDGAGQGGR
jgi:hypothetical protein